MSGFMEKFAKARREVRQIKKVAPWLLPEWQELEAAKDNLKAAQRRVKRAREAYANLGKD